MVNSSGSSIAGVKDAGSLKSGVGTKGELSRQLTNTANSSPGGATGGRGLKAKPDDDGMTTVIGAFAEAVHRVGIFGTGLFSLARAIGLYVVPVKPAFQQAAKGHPAGKIDPNTPAPHSQPGQQLAQNGQTSPAGKIGPDTPPPASANPRAPAQAPGTPASAPGANPAAPSPAAA